MKAIAQKTQAVDFDTINIFILRPVARGSAEDMNLMARFGQMSGDFFHPDIPGILRHIYDTNIHTNEPLASASLYRLLSFSI